GNGTRHAHACRNFRFRFELLIKFSRVPRQSRQILRRPQLPDQAGSVPCRAACQLLALKQDNVRPTALGQMISHRTSGNATANNYSSSTTWRRSVCGNRSYSWLAHVVTRKIKIFDRIAAVPTKQRPAKFAPTYSNTDAKDHTHLTRAVASHHFNVSPRVLWPHPASPCKYHALSLAEYKQQNRNRRNARCIRD
ncbi:MAG: hypothetical protein ACI89J_000322, partial [Hyphomicrobiaceae bacterium]